MVNTPKRAAARCERFNPRVFTARVIEDLAPYLPQEVIALRGVTCGDTVRSKLKDLLQNADASWSIATHAAVRQVEACVSKLPAWTAQTDQARRDRSLAQFHASERRCARTNKRLRFYRSHTYRLPDHYQEIIRSAQLFCEQVLDVPDPEMFDACGFGPGLTYGLPSDRRDLYHKVNGDQTVTPLLRPLAIEVLSSRFPAWAEHLAADRKLTVVRGNRVTFVPKSSSILRTIAIEPSLNVFLQKAVDTWMKNRFYRFGLRLRDQSYSTSLIESECRNSPWPTATVDLSSASDTLALEAVRWLLPAGWFVLLDRLRSKFYTTDKGKTFHPYEKFSSMGNATTFPVESLVFYALARSCVAYCNADLKRVRVYGDDIIVPPEAALLLIELLGFFGFSTNRDKTFVVGDFRETCGVDLLQGVDIRPVYVRSEPRTPSEVANLFNRLLTNRFGFVFESATSYLHSLVHRPLYGPASLGESHVEHKALDRRDWYEGKNRTYDAFFFAPDGTIKPHRSERYQVHAYRLETWYRPTASDARWSPDLRTFLLGVREGLPSRQNQTKIRTVQYYGQFPDLVWPDWMASLPRYRR